MSDPEGDLRRSAARWLAFADEDLRLARHALTLGDLTPYRLAAYHAQQCAEKCLKAYLVLRGLDFPYTHNIARLLELCAQYGDWAKDLDDAEELTPYAITARYPGTDDDVAEVEATRAIGIAARVRALLGSLLAEAGVNVSDG